MKLKALFKRKYVIWAVALALVAAAIWFFFFSGPGAQKEPFVARAGEFVNQISVSGKIVAGQNVDLSFESPGIIRGVYVKVGDTVSSGKLLASQDTAQLYAQASQMQAGIDLQKAKLAQLLAGSAPEDIKIKEDAVSAAKQDLQTTYASAVSSLTSAYNSMYNAYNVIVYTRSTYFNQPDQAGIKMQQIKSDVEVSLAAAQIALDSARMNTENTSISIDQMTAQLNLLYANLKLVRDLADQGIYSANISTTDKASLDTQRANINVSLTAILSSKQSIVSDKAGVVQAQNALEAIKAAPRVTDTAVYDAQIKQAKAQLDEIYAQINKKQVVAPISGTITMVNAKTGSIMGSTDVAVSIISTGKFQIESYVPEIYISSVKIGNEAEVTLDAYGAQEKFPAKVVFIDPSQTQKDGVSTYKTTLEFVDDDGGLKDGMSANVVIITNKKQNVISVPQGLIKVRDGKKFLQVQQGEEIMEKEVVTGDISSSGQVEIVTGLKEGDILPL